MTDAFDPAAAANLNRSAWNADAYEAWRRKYGAPDAAARTIVEDPWRVVRRLRPYLGDVRGLRVCSVQGSHGRVGVALARLGADVTVVDFSEDNRRYALELAAHAGVTLDYRVADVVQMSRLGVAPCDLVLMELGILHYHADLLAFFVACRSVLRPGGWLLLNEYHPVERKMFTMSEGTGGDYFHGGYVMSDVPFAAINGDGETCAYRYWTLGEILTGLLSAGFTLDLFEEHPDWTRPEIPGTFTLSASVASQ